VRELISLAEVGGGHVLAGECYAEGSVPYGPVAQMLRTVLVDAPDRQLDLAPPVVADLLTLAPDLRPHFAQVAANRSLETQVEQSRVFESFVTLCAALSARQPLLLFLDDAHWADSGTLFLLRHLARRARRQRLLIIITYRETDLDQACCLPEVLADLNRERLSARLKLGRLGLDGTRELLAALLQGPADEALTGAIYRETEGNPFFIEEVCKALVEEGQLALTDGLWRATHTDEIVIPQSVRVTIQARLGKLPEAAQEALRLAAVLGREFDFETLTRASEAGEDVLIAALESAEQAQLISETRRAARLTFSFAHALIPATLRESTSRLRRQRLHRRVALAIEALRPDDFEALAYHAERAGDEDRARAYYLRAGDRALAVFANQEAERHYHAALETLAEAVNGDRPVRAHALAGLGEALYRQGRYEQAIGTWRDAIPLYQQAGDSSLAARLYARMGRAAWQAGELPRGLAICREGLGQFADAPENPGLAYLTHETGRAFFFNARYEEAATLCQRALEMGRRLQMVEVQAEALATLGVLPGQSGEASAELLAQSVALAESAGLPATAIRGHINLGNALRSLGRHLSEPRDHFLRAREHARRIGHVAEELKCLVTAASTVLQMGNLTGYQDLAHEARELAVQVPRPHWYLGLLGFLDAIRLIELGDFEGGYQGALTARSFAEANKLDDLREEVEGTLAMLHAERGEWALAEAALQTALALASQGEHAVGSYCLLAIIQSEQGQTDAARATLERAQAQSGPWTPHPFLYLLAEARAYLAAAEKRWGDLAAEVATALQMIAPTGQPWTEAFFRVHFANLVSRENTPASQARARQLRQEALDRFRALGATQWVARLQAASAPSM